MVEHWSCNPTVDTSCDDFDMQFNLTLCKCSFFIEHLKSNNISSAGCEPFFIKPSIIAIIETWLMVGLF